MEKPSDVFSSASAFWLVNYLRNFEGCNIFWHKQLCNLHFMKPVSFCFQFSSSYNISSNCDSIFSVSKGSKQKHLHWHWIMQCFLVVFFSWQCKTEPKLIMTYVMVWYYRNEVKLLMKTIQVLSMLQYSLSTDD